MAMTDKRRGEDSREEAPGKRPRQMESEEDAEWALFQAAVANDEEPVVVIDAADQESSVQDTSSPEATKAPPKTLNRYEEMKLEQGQWMERLESLKERRTLKQTAGKRTTYRPVSSLVDAQDIQTIPLETLQKRLLSNRRKNVNVSHPSILTEDTPALSESSEDDDEE